MATFNGHRSWNAWNVSLWLWNDESLYILCREYVRHYGKTKAAERLLDVLPKTTPDGAPYTKTSISEALQDFDS